MRSIISRYIESRAEVIYNIEIFTPKLRTVLSTGAVLTPALAAWLAAAFGNICQISFSGGTDLCGSFLHGTPSLQSFPGELTVKALGMDVDVFSPDGKPLPDGESGELVCKKPFPNMPVMFWNDKEKQRYSSSYFETFPRKLPLHVLDLPDVWNQGLC
jgi:acetoacetyl-CoA synthetase